MGKYFGTDGFRGEANVVLRPEHAFKIGRFLGWHYGRSHKAKIVIGKDTRQSSYMFESAMVAGLTASGADAYLLHVTTTPNVSFAVRTECFDCGVMISASHNPYYDNGIKLLNADGLQIEQEIEEKIEAYLDSDTWDPPLAVRDEVGKCIDFASGRNRYIGYLISIPSRDFKNIRVGLDCANGSASAIVRSVFEALQAKVYVISAQPDGRNINDGCGSVYMERLRRFVLENGLDIGFAYDGDADRCLAVDHRGNILSGDRILYLCGKHLKEQGRLREDTIVTTVMSNPGLYQALDRENIRYIKTEVGNQVVARAMLREHLDLGGEQSGHIIFSRYAATGDGILTSLMVMEACAEKKSTLYELSREIREYPQVLRNVRVRNKQEAAENAAVRQAVRRMEAAVGSAGRILVRASETEPLIRIMAEAETDEICNKCVDEITAALVAEGLTM